MYESRENYLETILILQSENGSVRSIDIAKKLDFSKPSVSRAVAILKNDKYIDIDEKGYIKLTSKGEEKAKSIYERHRLLTKFFVETAKVEKAIAEEDACRIEHIISDETFQGIKEFLKDVSK
ncbi:Mn-dependent DtxR family transcriptional regulator [Clostridium acetobutylicum]|uniref:Iron-dependent transcription repressor n=1 Tax=Clostridium acetobutylicum (strain ATCC 824 / DSM 792 / JCM 1419 / IAM 19013 / LMG 5710 / NBRC 13948 / NRRL B-527 / VKM B-1787 / 2291 / W) TaxID=272562 RepID=Q97J17_CLOAB|nr:MULTISPECIES: metal-dependent transcriptional regulator [Clostridium]AAK79437.1 Iron-dependent transcription repressor [Clostridium acetobutylicum ATCC 824]ADZ20522.1 Iron-dependent transcription repressor [Clostridium acetobutylicum EA 2018]AEI34038.1 Iron-dependent transcription repressor [Clostridium acetobutylicum DSM 1731]AWV81316.1 metal-dependent transcriptional regulator [Clostridium acetobutylicum]MBC2392950.1 metal-dependent transcriptional regulator [Clostridium acetobutylicum]